MEPGGSHYRAHNQPQDPIQSQLNPIQIIILII
jgi:hypothetical protein